MSDEILVEQQQSIATVVLNRPERHDALTVEMYGELPGIVAALDADSSVKVIILRGAGQRAFASGADISEFERVRGNAVSARKYNDRVATVERSLETLGKPTIAMIHGYCIGGGAGLAPACDMRFADSTAQFAITPAKLGLVYSLESPKRIVDLGGPARAKWILLSGNQISSELAWSLGLFDEVKSPGELEKSTYGFAETISRRAQFSVRMGKEMIRRVTRGQTHDDDETRDTRNSSFGTSDYKEGVQAFLAKRRPNFL
ncbi:enoyl-CoA hydratase-related protein [Arthrobacter sp. ISL-28]|uniref:enoyl-CoA hydratase-related protein n=1 Tax=Arthrobacter sp. ISL-28 TaxID=2819108 RepID=UPI001BE7F45C|nr:enoyl-CoA hydratase-related protein [Arthrobacter sp. ISL-28]MBT2522603.1 enoyl-CoA hydratase/isomerase family protein [Arthrobacter sp. ISL-28]